MRAASGTVYLVGAGPGAPDLLTLRAARLLARADVVFHDALVHPDTLALAVRARIVAVGKRSGARSAAQRFINKRLVDAAQAHAVVVRLKGGDPMLFGRAQEEIEALEAANVRYEIVPGVTAALAAAADLRTSLTVRGSVRSFTFVTPRAADDAAAGGWSEALRHAEAGAIYMGLREAPAIAQALIDAGSARTTPVAIVADASLPSARIRHATLDNLAAHRDFAEGAPALVLIGPQFRERAAPSQARADPAARSAEGNPAGDARPAEDARCA
jgi:uroporphyrin-III C-methyltransferase